VKAHALPSPASVPAVVNVVLIYGPIASGKSSLATALGGRLRDAGRLVAVFDIDDEVAAHGGYESLSPRDFSSVVAQVGDAAAARASAGSDVVVHGPLFEEGARESVVSRLPLGARVWTVLLHVSYDVALARVFEASDRGRSRDPAFLRSAIDRFQSSTYGLPPFDWTFDSGSMGVTSMVDVLSAALHPC
jgi:chloramphenicol 3-O-phosphotransferase